MQFLQRQKSRLIHFSDGIELRNINNNRRRRSQHRHHDESGCESDESEDKLFHLETLPDHFPENDKNKKGGNSDASTFGGNIKDEDSVGTGKY